MRHTLLLLTIIVLIGCASTTNEQPVASSENIVARQETIPSLPATGYALLIQQLGNDEWETRDRAQKQLEDWPADKIVEIEPAIKDAAESKEPEIRLRAKQILTMITLKKEFKFSEGFLKEFPDIYNRLFRNDVSTKIAFLKTALKSARKKHPETPDPIMNQDVANIISCILSEENSSLPEEEKLMLIFLIKGSSPEENQPKKAGLPYVCGKIIPEAKPSLYKLLSDHNNSIRAESFRALYHQFPDKELIPGALKIIDNPDWRTQTEAIDLLVKFEVRDAIPKLRKLMKNRDSYSREHAIIALGQLGDFGKEPGDKKIVRGIIKKLSENSYANGEAIRKIGAKYVVPEILDIFAGEDEELQLCASYAMREIGAKDIIAELIITIDSGGKDIAPQILAILETQKETTARKTTVSIIGYGNYAKGTEKIINFLDDADGELRALAAISLVELGSKDKIPEKELKGITGDIGLILDWGDIHAKRARAALKELGVTIEDEVKDKVEEENKK
jgi:HEAT repeat protein